MKTEGQKTIQLLSFSFYNEFAVSTLSLRESFWSRIKWNQGLFRIVATIIVSCRKIFKIFHLISVLSNKYSDKQVSTFNRTVQG